MKLMPIQNRASTREGSCVPEPVYMKAYEVYCEVYGPQVSIITGDCRGGFGVNELVSFLYAASFPQNEWSDRVKEAFAGMKGL